MVQTNDDTDKGKMAKTSKAPKTKEKRTASAKKTAEEVQEEQATVDSDEQDPMFISARPNDMDTAAINSAPHPELWPSPDSDPDAEADNPSILVVPGAPSTNFEYTIKASGLPPNSGVVFRIDGSDTTGEPTFLTHKADPFGDAHVVWRSRVAGTQKVAVLRKNDHELGKEVVSEDFEVIDPVEDKRLGEARGHA